MKETHKTFAFIVKKGTFEEYSNKHDKLKKYLLGREEAIQTVVPLLNEKDIVVSTTGMISRELYENRTSHEKDFLTVGSMGHASSIAFGVALNKPDRKVFCFDGDGAFLMHMGAAAVIASRQLANLKHIVFNNEAHDSVGGQPTVMGCVDLTKIAFGCGYKKIYQAFSAEEIQNQWSDFYSFVGPCLMEIKVKSGARKNLGRPKEKPVENKQAFMRFVEN
jgi:phosphonopyruvate decarboxylase